MLRCASMTVCGYCEWKKLLNWTCHPPHFLTRHTPGAGHHRTMWPSNVGAHCCGGDYSQRYFSQRGAKWYILLHIIVAMPSFPQSSQSLSFSQGYRDETNHSSRWHKPFIAMTDSCHRDSLGRERDNLVMVKEYLQKFSRHPICNDRVVAKGVANRPPALSPRLQLLHPRRQPPLHHPLTTPSRPYSGGVTG